MTPSKKTRLIVVLITFAAAFRGLLGLAGYFAPQFLMEQLGAPPTLNPHMPFVVRVWAVRDIVLAGLLIRQRYDRALVALSLVAIIDAVDIVTALLAAYEGPYDIGSAMGLAATAVAALIPELAAIALLRSRAVTSRESAR